jgi:phosphate transport system substrate-binding protein
MKGVGLMLGALLAAAAPAADPIRIWGPPAMRGIAQRWADAYAGAHPGVRFVLTMKGSDTAIPGLYGGQADIALMGRPNDAVDDNGFSRPMQRGFVRIPLTSGSLAFPGKSDALAILVAAGNPIASLSLAELDGILSCERRRGHAPVRTWGDLGLTGTWARRPIHVYTYDMAERTGIFLQQVVAKDSRKMCWDHVSEYADGRHIDGTLAPAAERIAEAARADPGALAISSPAYARDGLRLVPVGERNQAVLPTRATVIDGSYSLARRTYAFVDRLPGKPIDPRVADFLRFALSEQGAALLAADEGYLPLSPAEAAASRQIVDVQ